MMKGLEVYSSSFKQDITLNINARMNQQGLLKMTFSLNLKLISTLN